MTFYENYVKLCARANKTPSGVAVELGIPKSLVSRWKNGGGASDVTAQKIADYFGVSLSELTGKNYVTIELFEGLHEAMALPYTKKDPDVLTDTEAKLVDLLMQLTPAEEQKVLAYIEGLLDNRAN